MGNGATDASEGVSGDGWVSTLNVTAGETYLLMANHWSPPAANQGFNIIWNLTNGASLDCVVLPIELTNFTGRYDGDDVILNWETQSETNNDYFTVERSIDGVNFEFVGIKDGAGNSNTTLHYEYIDKNPLEGSSYYRLKQTDTDGKHEYSSIVSINVKPKYEDVIVYPNPVNGNGFLSFNSTVEEEQTLNIYDVAGRLVYQKKYMITSGGNKLSMETTNLTQGMYFINLGDAKDGIKIKFIKE
jgi:hypothetical protein